MPRRAAFVDTQRIFRETGTSSAADFSHKVRRIGRGNLVVAVAANTPAISSPKLGSMVMRGHDTVMRTFAGSHLCQIEKELEEPEIVNVTVVDMCVLVTIGLNCGHWEGPPKIGTDKRG